MAAPTRGRAMTETAAHDDVHELVEKKNFAALKTLVRGRDAHDLAELLGDLEGEDLAMVFRLLPQEEAAVIFGDLELDKQEALLRTLSTENVAAILNDMPPDERTELLEELPGEMAQRLLSALRGEELKIARALLAYPADSIGRLMTPEYVAIRPEWTVEQVFAHLRTVAATKETISVLYVTDAQGRLVDEVALADLVLAEPGRAVADLMDGQVASLRARDDQEAAVEIFRKYEAVALPVVDRKGTLVGIVTVDDVIDVAEEEYTEDVQKMVGMDALEGSYFGTGFGEMVRKRLPWLALLLVAQTFTAVALMGFDHLPLFAALVVFVPLINSPAGNTGSQMAGLMIRGLAVAEVELADWWRVLLREVVHGATLGAALGVLGFGAAAIFSLSLRAGGLGGQVAPTHIALAVALAIALSVTLGNIIGSMLPFLFKRMALDPAVTSGPFIASLMDVSCILIYFTIAMVLLRLLS